MSKKILFPVLLAASAVAPLVADIGDAHAQRRTNGLEDDVAVRHRRLLVAGRFELAPLFESTINADFRHIIGGGAKLEYHLGDMLSFGVVGVYGTSLDTGLVKKIMPTLEDDEDPDTREPSQREYQSHLNKMPFHGAAYVSITPWYGKLAAFGQAFVAFDFYFQAGVSFAQLSSDCPESVCSDPSPGMGRPNPNPDNDPNTDDTELPPDGDPNNDDPLNGVSTCS
jgi:hypothetical protein